MGSKAMGKFIQDETIIPVLPEWAQKAYITQERYEQMYRESIENPDAFWSKEAEKFVWHNEWTTIKNTRFELPVSIKWFEGATLNITENCLDRHLHAHGDKTAIIWEGDSPDHSRRISYRQLYEQVCRLGNVLRQRGVKKGDRVTIYMPMIPEAVVAALACARIGAVHSIVFGGFSAEALRGRIDDCGSQMIITADGGMRGSKTIPLKNNVDDAIRTLDTIHSVIVVKHVGQPVAWDAGRDIWYHEAVSQMPIECPTTSMDAEDPLFILYTSGSTGKPKGVLHTTAGYMVWASVTHRYCFDIRDDDVFWCTADVGWVTGHTYLIYGPLLNATTTVMYEGVPNYPDFGRFWQIADKHQVTIFHTAPTAIRAIMREGNALVQKSSRKSLRLLGSVGEPINPEAWNWYWEVVGEKRLPIVDTWWQTETGGTMITPFPGATPLKPGAASMPFFGVKPMILDDKGKILEGACEGMLCIADSWPGQARTIYGDHERFEYTYFSQVPGMYFTGDGAKRDKDGYYWITGRIDDVINVSGHRLGTAEIESALVAHPQVAEAAVVGIPHDIKGQGIYAYVTLNAEVEYSLELEKDIIKQVRTSISAIATPDHLHFTPALPKTRSGKIMRRILRKIAEGEYSNLGDTSTLTNPEIVDLLIKDRKN